MVQILQILFSISPLQYLVTSSLFVTFTDINSPVIFHHIITSCYSVVICNIAIALSSNYFSSYWCNTYYYPAVIYNVVTVTTLVINCHINSNSHRICPVVVLQILVDICCIRCLYHPQHILWSYSTSFSKSTPLSTFHDSFILLQLASYNLTIPYTTICYTVVGWQTVVLTRGLLCLQFWRFDSYFHFILKVTCFKVRVFYQFVGQLSVLLW